jgi:isoquinoline 1-oxidoreductase beta subunit
MNTIAHSSRRNFLKTTAIASGGLLVGFALPGLRGAEAAGTLYTPNAWVHIADDNTITLISARSEMGQGVYTSPAARARCATAGRSCASAAPRCAKC